MVLYDIIDFTPKKLDIKKVGVEDHPTTKMVESDRLNTPTIDSISKCLENVNTKNDSV